MFSKIPLIYFFGLTTAVCASGIASVFFGLEFFINLLVFIFIALGLNLSLTAVLHFAGSYSLRDVVIEVAFGFCNAGALFAIWYQLSNFKADSDQIFISAFYTILPLIIMPIWVHHFRNGFREYVKRFRDGNEYAVGMILKAFESEARFFYRRDWAAFGVKIFLVIWTIYCLGSVVHLYGRWEVMIATTLCSGLFWISVAAFSKSIGTTNILRELTGDRSIDTKKKISLPIISEG